MTEEVLQTAPSWSRNRRQLSVGVGVGVDGRASLPLVCRHSAGQSEGEGSLEETHS